MSVCVGLYQQKEQLPEVKDDTFTQQEQVAHCKRIVLDTIVPDISPTDTSVRVDH